MRRLNASIFWFKINFKINANVTSFLVCISSCIHFKGLCTNLLYNVNEGNSLRQQKAPSQLIKSLAALLKQKYLACLSIEEIKICDFNQDS